MNNLRTALAVSALLSLGTAGVGQQMLVLSGGTVLSTITAANPGVAVGATVVSGLQTGETLRGIDIRPATGQLYGLGSSNRLYVIDRTTGVATAVGAAPFSPAITGTRVGFDFNPTVDRIRVVGDDGQNLRLHPDLGTVAFADPALAFAATDVNAGAATNVAGAGYINSVAGAVTTTLYDIDVGLDILATQNPANAGTLNTVGSLGFNAGDVGGFDIDGTSGAAFAAMSTAANQNGSSALFGVNLLNGAASFLGTIGVVGPVGGLVVLPAPTPGPAPAPESILCLTAGGVLAQIDSRVPGAVFRAVPVSGLAIGETLVGIDFRPSTRVLYGVGSSSRLYTIDPTTGVATAVGPTFSTPLSGTHFAVDFNPVVDLLRVVSDANQNLRISPLSGFVVGTDPSVAFAPTDVNAGVDPNIGGAAYINSVAGAATTALYDIDFGLDILVTQVPANLGVLVTVGALGVDATGSCGFDVSGAGGTAYAALTTAGGGVGTSELFRINLATGQATFVGSIGLGSQVRGIAVIPNPGAQAFGLTTEGCNGPIATAAIGEPRLGNLGFGIAVANAPSNALGYFAYSDYILDPGVTAFGATIHVAMVSTLAGYTIEPTNALGQGLFAAPVPIVPSLLGAVVVTQWFFYDPCAPGIFSASNALAITIQP